MTLPEGAILQVGRGSPFGHDNPIRSLGIAGPGFRFATGESNGTVNLWKTEEGVRALTKELGGGPIAAVALPDDSRRIAAASRDAIKVIDAQDGEVLWTGRHDGQDCTGVAFAPDGESVVSVGFDCRVRVWTAAVGQEAGGRDAGAELTGVAFALNGAFFVTVDISGGVTIWEPDGGDRIGDVTAAAIVDAVAISPSGRYLLTGCRDGTARVFDVEKKREVRVLETKSPTINSVAFSGKGSHLVAVGSDGMIWLFDRKADKPKKLRGHEGAVNAVVFDRSRDAMLTAGEDGTLKAWSVRSGRDLFPPEGHDGAVTAVAWGDSIASGGADRKVHVWDPDIGVPLASFYGHEDGVGGVTFLDEMTLVAADCASKLAVHRIGQPGRAELFGGESFAMEHAIALVPGTQLVVSSLTLSIWDCQRGAELLELPGIADDDEYGAIAASPDGQIIVAGRAPVAAVDGEMTSWAFWQDPFVEEPWRPDWKDNVGTLAFSPRGDLIASAAGNGKHVRIRAVADFGDEWKWKISQQMQGHEDAITGLAFSPNGKYVASVAKDETLRIWDAVSGKELRCFSGACAPLCWSPNGQQIVTGAVTGGLLIWRLSKR